MLKGKRDASQSLSASHEHYLRAIWEVRLQRGYARLTDVARELGIAPPSLLVGVRALERRGLVAHDEHRFLVLTAGGERIAREVHHRHAVMFSFLRDVLGISEAIAERDACRLEHQVSGATTERVLDLIQLLRQDAELRAFFQRRFTEYHRTCRPKISECATCDLACLATLGKQA